VLEQRLLQRGQTSGRSDDNIESIKKRFKTFTGETMPVVAYYEALGMVSAFDGARPIDEVWTDTKAAVQAYIAKYDAEK